MNCNECQGVKKDKQHDGLPPVLEIVNGECPVIFHTEVLDANFTVDNFPPTVGLRKNVLLEYADGHRYLYSSDGIPTDLSSSDTEVSFDHLLNRPSYAGAIMTSATDIPDVNASIATAVDDITEITDGLRQDIVSEANTRAENDLAVEALVSAEAATRAEEDRLIRADITQAIADETADIRLVQQELNRNFVNDLEMEANAQNVTFIEDKVNPYTGATSQERDTIPTASATAAGIISAAEFNSITDSQEKVEALLGGAVAITGLSANVTQQQLTDAWKQETGRTELINRASIYDVTNSIVWTYYTNVTTWEPISASGSVSVAQFTNSSLGTIKGSTTDGNVGANTDGTGSVNGWTNLVNSVANKASQSDMTTAQGNITTLQSDIVTINGTLATKADISSIPTATSDLTNDSDFVSDANYVHTDNNYTTVEKQELADVYTDAARVGSTVSAGGVQIGTSGIENGAVTQAKTDWANFGVQPGTILTNGNGATITGFATDATTTLRLFVNVGKISNSVNSVSVTFPNGTPSVVLRINGNATNATLNSANGVTMNKTAGILEVLVVASTNGANNFYGYMEATSGDIQFTFS